MKIQKELFLLSVLSLTLGACSVELKDKDNGATAPTVQLQQLSASHIQTQTVGQAQPNVYDVEFSWAPVAGNIRISDKSNILGFVAGDSSIFRLSGVAGGSELSVLLDQVDKEGRVLVTLPVVVKVPADLVFEGAVELHQPLKIQAARVFLAKGVTILTRDHDFTIETRELIADGARLLNFPEGATAGLEKSGASGGHINIIAESARGSLLVELRGENGGAGRPGAITNYGGHPGCAGTNGWNGGSSGSFVATFGQSEHLDLLVVNEAGQKGLAGLRNSVPKEAPYAIRPPCLAETPNGIDGQAGGKGQVCIQRNSQTELVCKN